MEQVGEIAASECPRERSGNCFIVVLEPEQSLFERIQRGEVIGRQDLALDDGKVDLDWLSQLACTGP